MKYKQNMMSFNNKFINQIHKAMFSMNNNKSYKQNNKDN